MILFNLQSGRSFLTISVLALKSGQVQARSVYAYSRDEIILPGEIIYFARLGTSDNWRCAGRTKDHSETGSAREYTYPLILVGHGEPAGATTICVFQRTLGSLTSEISSQSGFSLKFTIFLSFS